VTLKKGWRSPVDWEAVRADFAPDGAWRDVYVFDTSASDWQLFINMIRERRLPMRFFVDGEDAELPSDVMEIFALWEAHSPLLRLAVRGLDLNCHFFTEDQLELDLDPEMIDEHRVVELVDFIVSLGDLLKKDVVVTYENVPTAEIIRYVSTTGVVSVGRSHDS